MNQDEEKIEREAEPTDGVRVGPPNARAPSLGAWLTLALTIAASSGYFVFWRGRERRAVTADLGETSAPSGDDHRAVRISRSSSPFFDLSREDWKAKPVSDATEPLTSPRRVTVHHVGDRDVSSDEREATARLIRGIQQNHQQKRRWVDIGYHLIVDRAGRVWQGRSLDLVGAHAGPGGANVGNVGVLALGNFDRQRLTSAQTLALKRCLDRLRERFSIAPGEVYTHREIRALHGLGTTDCPGKRLQTWVDDYREELTRSTFAASSNRS